MFPLAENDLSVQKHGGKVDVVGGMMVGRQAQEVQMAMLVAKRFPRDEMASIQRITAACKRRGLAEVAQYVYPRGGTKVTGPSIRLAEAIAQSWGNIDYGVIELDNTLGESHLLAYAWDLETNTRATKAFSVKHRRKANGTTHELTDDRDIYEATANFGARRVRACILEVIPGDVVEDAVKECQKTLRDNKTPLDVRVKAILDLFDKDHGVSKEQIETYLGCPIRSITEEEVIRLKGVFQSLSDGMSKPVDFFGKGEKNLVDPLKNTPATAQKATPVPRTKQEQPKTGEKTQNVPNGHSGLEECYACKRKNVKKDQADKTRKEFGKALCVQCEGFQK